MAAGNTIEQQGHSPQAWSINSRKPSTRHKVITCQHLRRRVIEHKHSNRHQSKTYGTFRLNARTDARIRFVDSTSVDCLWLYLSPLN